MNAFVTTACNTMSVLHRATISASRLEPSLPPKALAHNLHPRFIVNLGLVDYPSTEPLSTL